MAPLSLLKPGLRASSRLLEIALGVGTQLLHLLHPLSLLPRGLTHQIAQALLRILKALRLPPLGLLEHTLQARRLRLRALDEETRVLLRVAQPCGGGPEAGPPAAEQGRPQAALVRAAPGRPPNMLTLRRLPRSAPKLSHARRWLCARPTEQSEVGIDPTSPRAHLPSELLAAPDKPDDKKKYLIGGGGAASFAATSTSPQTTSSSFSATSPTSAGQLTTNKPSSCTSTSWSVFARGCEKSLARSVGLRSRKRRPSSQSGQGS